MNPYDEFETALAQARDKCRANREKLDKARETLAALRHDLSLEAVEESELRQAIAQMRDTEAEIRILEELDSAHALAAEKGGERMAALAEAAIKHCRGEMEALAGQWNKLARRFTARRREYLKLVAEAGEVHARAREVAARASRAASHLPPPAPHLPPVGSDVDLRRGRGMLFTDPSEVAEAFRPKRSQDPVKV